MVVVPPEMTTDATGGAGSGPPGTGAPIGPVTTNLPGPVTKAPPEMLRDVTRSLWPLRLKSPWRRLMLLVSAIWLEPSNRMAPPLMKRSVGMATAPAALLRATSPWRTVVGLPKVLLVPPVRTRGLVPVLVRPPNPWTGPSRNVVAPAVSKMPVPLSVTGSRQWRALPSFEALVMRSVVGAPLGLPGIEIEPR
jgi:hypothetical protein